MWPDFCYQTFPEQTAQTENFIFPTENQNVSYANPTPPPCMYQNSETQMAPRQGTVSQELSHDDLMEQFDDLAGVLIQTLDGSSTQGTEQRYLANLSPVSDSWLTDL